jgi:hypothetical protein
VLFHETKDKRVVKFCKGSQFRTMELPTNVWVQLTDDAAVLCGATRPDRLMVGSP